jgi:hypothetical protein
MVQRPSPKNEEFFKRIIQDLRSTLKIKIKSRPQEIIQKEITN